MTTKTDQETPRVVVHAELCKSCGRCIAFCPAGCLEPSEALNRAGFRPTRHKAGVKCKGCGICFYSCPEPGAITVYKKETKEKK